MDFDVKGRVQSDDHFSGLFVDKYSINDQKLDHQLINLSSC